MMQDSTANPITPAHFWDEFSKSLHADWNSPESTAQASYNDATLWTAYITKFCVKFASQFSFIPKTEFWPRVDVAYFDRSNANWGEWALEVAIELENKEGWHEELSKLLMVNAGLKVLIAYEDHSERIQEMMNHFVRIHASRKYLTNNSGWLFIFGPRLIPARRDFVALTFDGHSITDITAGHRTVL